MPGGGLPPGVAGPPSSQLAPAYVYSASRAEFVPVQQLGPAPPVQDIGICRVRAPMATSWNVTLSPFSVQGQPLQVNGTWLNERDDVLQAVIRWGSDAAGFEAVLDWFLGASFTVWGNFVDVAWRVKMGGGGAVTANLGNQRAGVGASILPGSGPGHPAYRRPTLSVVSNSGAVTPVPRFSRWLWLQPDSETVQVDVQFNAGNGALLARYFYNFSGTDPFEYLTPCPVPHGAATATITDQGGSTLKYQYEMELG